MMPHDAPPELNSHRRGAAGDSTFRGLAALAALITLTASATSATPSATGSIAGLEAKFVDVGGVRTRYYEAGAGEPIVLVHGDGWSGHSSANMWSKNIAGLSKRFHVFAADKLGSGMTDNPRSDNDYNLQGEVDHMYRFIQTMRLGKVHLVGQARGSTLVLFLAAQHPEVVKTLIIVNSGNAAPDAGLTGRAAALAGCQKDQGFEEWKCRLRALSFSSETAFDDEFWEAGKYMGNLPKSKEAAARIRSGAGEPLSSQTARLTQHLHERIRNEGLLQMPTLLYWGVEDPNNSIGFPPAKAGLLFYDILSVKNSKVRMLITNRSGLFHFREHAEEFNNSVMQFIDNWNQ